MFNIFKVAFIIVTISIFFSCGADSGSKSTDVTPNTTTKSTDEKPVEIMKEPNFSPTQLTPRLLNLCVQFKNLKGQNRKAVFEQLQNVLPQCPISIKEDNTSDFDFGNAMQKMTQSDLVEVLGAPDEIRQEGTVVYQLEQDYNVVFFMDEKEIVVCRAIEGNS